MRREGDFTAKTKRILAQRCGYRCNNPACRTITIGAHSNPNKVVSFGQACHIEAALPGGPRYNSHLTIEQRQSINNGIWLCYSCSKIVDSDIERFSVSLLREWKREAEDWNLREAKIQVEPDSLKILSVTNIAGGTGKSFATAMISRMIAAKKHERVLCVSAHEADHVLYYLDDKLDINETLQATECKSKERHMTSLSPMEMQREVVLASGGVDILPFGALQNIAIGQECKFGEMSIGQVLIELAAISGYHYIVCDCGRGDTKLQTAILNNSTDIIVPLGERVYFDATVEFVSQYSLQATLRKNIWFFLSKGPNKYVAHNLLPYIAKLPQDKANVCVLETTIPYCKSLGWRDADALSSKKNIKSAYRKIVDKMI